jgi:hypothetical protein
MHSATARLVGAMLPGIEHGDVGETAPTKVPMREDVRTTGGLLSAHRHMFVPRLQCRRTSEQESFGRRTPLTTIPCPVVYHFVVVKAWEEWARRMGELQVRVALV